MADQVDLKAKSQMDKDAELARLREENARLQAKRDNDERSAFGRLEREAELRRQREAELADMRRRMAELEAKNAMAALPPESAEALGEAGVKGVRTLLDIERQRLPELPTAKLEEMESRLSALQRQQEETLKRQAYNNALVTWAAQNGTPGLFARLGPGGDLGEKWAAFAQQNPGAVAAFENGDTEGTKAYVRLFMYENPGISQQAATPPQAGGFAAPAGGDAYGPQQWIAEIDELEKKLATGQISRQDHAKAFAEANAKLAAAQKRA